MARAAVLGRLTWQVATVVALRDETAGARTLVVHVDDWPGHRAGQHVDVRLTAEDGYSAQRSYSIASAPDGDRFELTVDRIDDGEVSPYLTLEVIVGDMFEVRGPLGGWFVWAGDERPVLLVAGGSGVVPLAAMLRTRAAVRSSAPFLLVYSVRNEADALFSAELDSTVRLVYTREPPPGFPRAAGRITAADLDVPGWTAGDHPAVFVCGPSGFVEAAADLLVGLGHTDIKTERFGPTGVRS